jgi:hypothetical protein
MRLEGDMAMGLKQTCIYDFLYVYILKLVVPNFIPFHLRKQTFSSPTTRHLDILRSWDTSVTNRPMSGVFPKNIINKKECQKRMSLNAFAGNRTRGPSKL